MQAAGEWIMTKNKYWFCAVVLCVIGHAAFVDAQELLVISKDHVNFRSAPALNSEIIRNFPYGEILEMHGDSGNWYFAEEPATSCFGWVNKQCATPLAVFSNDVVGRISSGQSLPPIAIYRAASYLHQADCDGHTPDDTAAEKLLWILADNYPSVPYEAYEIESTYGIVSLWRLYELYTSQNRSAEMLPRLVAMQDSSDTTIVVFSVYLLGVLYADSGDTYSALASWSSIVSEYPDIVVGRHIEASGFHSHKAARERITLLLRNHPEMREYYMRESSKYYSSGNR